MINKTRTTVIGALAIALVIGVTSVGSLAYMAHILKIEKAATTLANDSSIELKSQVYYLLQVVAAQEARFLAAKNFTCL